MREPLTQSEQYDLDSERQERWDNLYWWLNAAWTSVSVIFAVLVLAAIVRICWAP